MSECPVAKLETSYRECIAQLVAEEPSTGINYQDESRLTVEHAVNKFNDAAREAEAIFLKHRLTAANKNPEWVLLQEIEELTVEIKQKDEVIKNCLLQLKQWQQNLYELNKICFGKIPPPTPLPPTPNNSQTRK